MYANNEIGTVQPIVELARAVKAVNPGTLFHTDAVQAGGLLPIDVQAMGVDMLALSGHKFYAPKGSGLVYVRRGTPLVHQVSGGGQERGVRAGTENVAYIVGMARALELAYAESQQRVAHVSRLRDRLVDGVRARIAGVRLTGHPTQRMPNSASFTIAGAVGHALRRVASQPYSSNARPHAIDQPVAQARNMRHALLRFSVGQLECPGHAHDVGDVLGPGPH